MHEPVASNDVSPRRRTQSCRVNGDGGMNDAGASDHVRRQSPASPDRLLFIMVFDMSTPIMIAREMSAGSDRQAMAVYR